MTLSVFKKKYILPGSDFMVSNHSPFGLKDPQHIEELLCNSSADLAMTGLITSNNRCAILLLIWP